MQITRAGEGLKTWAWPGRPSRSAHKSQARTWLLRLRPLWPPEPSLSRKPTPNMHSSWSATHWDCLNLHRNTAVFTVTRSPRQPSSTSRAAAKTNSLGPRSGYTGEPAWSPSLEQTSVLHNHSLYFTSFHPTSFVLSFLHNFPPIHFSFTPPHFTHAHCTPLQFTSSQLTCPLPNFNLLQFTSRYASFTRLHFTLLHLTPPRPVPALCNMLAVIHQLELTYQGRGKAKLRSEI